MGVTFSTQPNCTVCKLSTISQNDEEKETLFYDILLFIFLIAGVVGIFWPF